MSKKRISHDPKNPNPYKLKDLLEQINPEGSETEEVDWGPAVGKEFPNGEDD